MGRFSFNPNEPADVLDFQERIKSLPETDLTIATMVMAGHTQREIGAVVGLARRTISDRIKKLSRIFRPKGQFISLYI